ncbi:MAG: CHAT domain-containing protein, partial [Nostoc sp.]
VPEELSIVAKDIWKGKFFLNQNFTLKNLKSIRSSQPFGIIHLATHGEFEKGAPDNSFVQFWDNKLKLSQMRDLGLNNPTVELLVLSACRTALGDRDAELGFGGFAYITGVKTALASLWQVSDSGTLALMTEFYKNLKTAPTKSEALRQAQLAMIKGQVTIENGQMRTSVRSVALPPESPESKETKDLKHPFYWSAFTMIGNPW